MRSGQSVADNSQSSIETKNAKVNTIRRKATEILIKISLSLRNLSCLHKAID